MSVRRESWRWSGGSYFHTSLNLEEVGVGEIHMLWGWVRIEPKHMQKTHTNIGALDTDYQYKTQNLLTICGSREKEEKI